MGSNMIWKRGFLYDGVDKITVDYSYGGISIRFNGRRMTSSLLEQEISKMLPKLVVISRNCYITEYDGIAMLVYKGRLKRLDKDIGKYIGDLPEL